MEMTIDMLVDGAAVEARLESLVSKQLLLVWWTLFAFTE
jgi:hypothetical protein